VDFKLAVRYQAGGARSSVAGLRKSHFVTGGGIEVRVSELDRVAVQRFRVTVPRHSPWRIPARAEARPGRMKERRVLVETFPWFQVRPIRWIAEVVIEPARPGVRPVYEFLDCSLPRGLAFQESNF